MGRGKKKKKSQQFESVLQDKSNSISIKKEHHIKYIDIGIQISNTDVSRRDFFFKWSEKIDSFLKLSSAIRIPPFHVWAC